VADGLYRVGGGVDDGHHGRDDPEEDSPAHRCDRRDVQLVDEEASLLVENVQHFMVFHPVPQSRVEDGLIFKESKCDAAIGLLCVYRALTGGSHPRLGAKRGAKKGDGQAREEEGDKDERALLQIHLGSLVFISSQKLALT